MQTDERVTDAMVEAACIAALENYTPWHHETWNIGEERANFRRDIRAVLSAALSIERLQGGTEVHRREGALETIVAPDNGSSHEVLSAVLACANAWVPEARIIGNVRAGDIARVLSPIVAKDADNG